MAMGTNVFAATPGSVSASVQAEADAGLAFGNATTSSTDGPGLPHPASGFGMAFWFGVGGLASLIFIYRSLPG